MSYRCVATSVAGFVQQLAVAYLTNGYYFYVTGRIPAHKDPGKSDRKILEQYGIAISKWARSRRKKEGQANVHYLRFDRFYVILANQGEHPFFAAEAKRIRDARKSPILFMGYAVGYRRARGGGAYHASVRIDRNLFQELKGRFQRLAVHWSLEEICRELLTLPFEPYAPIRSQLQGILRAVNLRRKVASLEPVPREALRLNRSPVRPFEEKDDSRKTNVRSEALHATEGAEERFRSGKS